VHEEAAKLGSIDMGEYDKGDVDETDVRRGAQFWFGTINGILDVMRLQDSKVAAKTKAKELAASRAASQAGSVSGSIPPSTASIVSIPISSGSTTVSTATSSASITTTRKRAAPEITLGPLLKRNKQAPSPPASPAEPKTPDQPSQPANPDLSHGSTATNISGNTVELKDEETTKVLINRFVTDSLFNLGAEFRKIHWHRGEHKIELMHTYILYSLLMSETKIQRQ
jgi:hypothetical protein